ncbi:MAG: hypothetical protein Q7R98_01135 [Candidatus Jorgensenbacteria bacterium]|nr:hypothetical protein [Candidatus Jorgensenbacteria bacterium]
MIKTKVLKIIEEANVIDDNLLDIIGNEFKFDHEKGLSEWLKNSVDAYIRMGIPDSEQYVLVRMMDGNKNDAVIEVIDFAGMSQVDVNKAFKRWGDPKAASRGSNKKVHGGHGNGGKFYMRQMFVNSHFATYKDGQLSIFGFNKKRKYGFADGFNAKKIKVFDAIKVAGIADVFFPDKIKEMVFDGKRGFTVVRGIGPEWMRNKIKFSKLMGKFRNHPQSRRIISRINVLVFHNDGDYVLLKPDELKPMAGFEIPRILEVPKELKYFEDGEETVVAMANKKYSNPGRLIIKTSEEALTKGSKLGDLNRVDIIGEIGVLASYSLLEIGVGTFPQASFLYGECECPILEDLEMDCVKNDRTKLVPNPRSNALIEWIRLKMDEIAIEIVSKERAEQEMDQRKISAAFNNYLNKWKDSFMNKIMSDLVQGEGGNFENGDEDEGYGRRILEIPENGFAFSFQIVEIPRGEEKKITLKALVPEPIPIGSIISLTVSNPKIKVADKELKIKSDGLRATPKGESVAVLNTYVSGDEVGEEGKLMAKVGKLEAEITLSVVKSRMGDKSKKPKSPKVLLSGTDLDPLGISSGGTVILTERNPVVYQRVQDVAEGIYWINTQSPLAKAILARYADNSIRWRDYLFQRYIDIFVKQILHELQKRDPEGFKADTVDNALDMKIMQIHSLAMSDLGKFFFDETFTPLDS